MENPPPDASPRSFYDVSQERLSELLRNEDPDFLQAVQALVSLVRESPNVSAGSWNSAINV
ncbi:hypothetical protein [Catellatospora sichuanensis]|uniref:hypothetical protein n=1 Tax=Catellatospora sichuanensis TaxID=1969805 RepID=UPI0011830537|nr:hypothetical protein [Catellatospora sichuanensis]